MTTAVGAYATAAALKTRIAISDSTDDTTLGNLCDQVNAYIEGPQGCGRVLAPVAAFSTTTNGALSVGATSVTLTSVTGLAVGDSILIGSTSGTREHVFVDVIATLTLTVHPALSNAYNSGVTAQRCYLFDGDGGSCLRFPKGIRTLTFLEVQFATNVGTFQVIPTTDYKLRPGPADLTPGWPFDRVELVNIPLGGIGYFPGGYDTVRALMTTGFAAIPDDITEVALIAATRAWFAVQAGQQDITGTDEMGHPMISRFFSKRDRQTLDAYSVSLPG